MPEATTIRGTVSRTFFVNPESPAMAGELDTEEGKVRFAGKCLAAIGDILEITGDWGEHPRFGRQFMVETGMVKLAETPEALAHLLAADLRFRGIGPVRARRIVDAALQLSEDGELASALIAFPGEIAQQANVAYDLVQAASEIWEEKRSHFAAITALLDQGWTSGQAQTIVAILGEDIAPIVAKDPYSLISKIPRFGFKTVDAVAIKMGVKETDPTRLACGLAYCLDLIANDGNTWTSREALLDRARQELRPNTLDAEDLILTALDSLIELKIIYTTTSPEGVLLVADAKIALTEMRVFELLIDGMLDYSLGGLKIPTGGTYGTLNAGQTLAVQGFARYRCSIISGGAGVGKTYTMRTICDIADANSLAVGLCAPTGKAARKLHHATGRKASTIHRLLEPIFDERTGGMRFLRNRGNKLEQDLIVVDEISMVDINLMRSLLDAIGPRTRLLLVGDHQQIPSVGAGAILRDLLSAKGRYPGAVHVLTEIVRQAGELARNTSALLDGIVASGESKVWQLRSIEKGHEDGTPAIIADVVRYVTSMPDLLPFGRQLDINWEVQILSPQKKGPLGVFILNAEIQKLRQEMLNHIAPPPVLKDRPSPPLVGDRVIWTVNDYELNLFNGTQAILMGTNKGAMMLFTEDGREVIIPPEKRKNVQLAYALTIHKSQGSEWPFVLLVASSKHWHMHDRNLFYTGASRASEALMIFGDKPGMHHFAQERKSVRRQTFGSFLVDGWDPSVLPTA